MKALGLETCCTLGMLRDGQAEALKAAGLDYYNHNLDTSPEFYGEVITTRDYQDRLDTLERVRAAGVSVCCGGIVGMGESRAATRGARSRNSRTWTRIPSRCRSITWCRSTERRCTSASAASAAIDPFEFVRTIAVARITMPKAMVRLSAGRRELGEAVQALCFLAGANSIFYGDKLLTTGNPDVVADRALFARLGLAAMDRAGGLTRAACRRS